MRLTNLPALALFVAFAAPALAATTPAETRLPLGEVACVSLRHATNYKAYATSAPDFAADLIQRAACYKVEGEMRAVPIGTEKGFDKYKLLTGHTVWVPAK